MASLTPTQYLDACQLGIQDRSPAYIQSRLDTEERLDKKCGNGAISEGEQCRSGGTAAKIAGGAALAAGIGAGAYALSRGKGMKRLGSGPSQARVINITPKSHRLGGSSPTQKLLPGAKPAARTTPRDTSMGRRASVTGRRAASTAGRNIRNTANKFGNEASKAVSNIRSRFGNGPQQGPAQRTRLLNSGNGPAMPNRNPMNDLKDKASFGARKARTTMRNTFGGNKPTARQTDNRLLAGLAGGAAAGGAVAYATRDRNKNN